jgi:Flp pilus assembly pilin Flp
MLMFSWGERAMSGLISRFLIDRRGGIAVEYALAAGLVGLAAVLALAALGDALNEGYEPVTAVTTQGHDLSNERDF